MIKFDKLLMAARYWLLGMAEHDHRYFQVIEALELGVANHTGLRNGGDPEFIHQLGIFHHLRTLHKHLRHPHTVYMLAFLHDLVEDCNFPLELIAETFGEHFAAELDLLSKSVLGIKKSDYSLEPVFRNVNTSAVKLADRVNNVNSMVGVFKRPRLQKYVLEVQTDFLPNIKISRRMFPDQEAIYENMKMSLENQITLVSQILIGYTPE